MVAQLRKHYYDHQRPGAYGGAGVLQRNTSLPTKTIQKWLRQQDTYTLHKPIRRRFQRRQIITGGINQQFQADLIDMRNLRKYNDGVGYLVTCLDVFSKYAWAIPIQKKTGKELVAAMTKIFDDRQPVNFQTDKGSEFVNRTFFNFLKERGVHFFTTENEDVKAAIVERFNRTLKEKMWRYFTKTNTLRYVDVLDSLLRNYNKSYHRSIRLAPAQVNYNNQEEVWNNLYHKTNLTRKVYFTAGDRVRLAQPQQPFKKSYLPGWTEELFTVSRINQTSPVTYVLKDDSGEELRGSFYREEIQAVGDKQVYRVETILQERRSLGGKEYLVKWFGYPNSFNSWIADTQLDHYGD